MKIKVSLQMIRNSNPATLHPYWWTSDRVIHLADADGMKREVEVDTDQLNFGTIQEIVKGVRKKVIAVDSIDNLQKAIDQYLKKDVKPVEVQEELLIQETATPQEEIRAKAKEKVNSEIEQEAERLAGLSVNKLKEAVGTHVLTENNELQSGIADLALLNLIKEKEEATGSPRKSAIEIVNLRIKAIEESNGVMFSDEEEEVKIKKEDLI